MVCCLCLWGDGGVLLQVLGVCLAHEAGHGLVMLLTGAGIREVRLHAAGMQMVTHTACLREWQRIAICLSGPAVNLLLAAALRTARPEAAALHLCMGAFNLLPYRVLDGGAALGDWRWRRGICLVLSAGIFGALAWLRVGNAWLYGMTGYLTVMELTKGL